MSISCKISFFRQIHYHRAAPRMKTRDMDSCRNFNNLLFKYKKYLNVVKTSFQIFLCFSSFLDTWSERRLTQEVRYYQPLCLQKPHVLRLWSRVSLVLWAGHEWPSRRNQQNSQFHRWERSICCFLRQMHRVIFIFYEGVFLKPNHSSMTMLEKENSDGVKLTRDCQQHLSPFWKSKLSNI